MEGTGEVEGSAINIVGKPIGVGDMVKEGEVAKDVGVKKKDVG